jgi:hypothetical protein
LYLTDKFESGISAHGINIVHRQLNEPFQGEILIIKQVDYEKELTTGMHNCQLSVYV